MRRLARFPAAALLLTSLALAPGAPAQPRRNHPTSTSAPAPTTPLGAAVAAANASDYAHADQLLAAITGQDRAAAQIALARTYLERGRFADADRTAQAAGGSADEKLQALCLRAEVLAAQGKMADAIALLDPEKDGHGHGGLRVRLLLGQYLIDTGKRADADVILKRFSEEWSHKNPSDPDNIDDHDAEAIAMAARSFHLRRQYNNANTLFGYSTDADANRVETLLWRAQLFLDKYDTGKSGELVKQALEIAPHRADALVFMARVKLEDAYDFDEAERLTKKALEVNPKHVGAHAIRSGLSLRDLDIGAAEAELAQGFAVNPNDLELWATKAAVRFLADDRPGYDQAKKEALTRNPEDSLFFRIVGDYAEWEHRYDDIITMMQEAVQVNPDDGKAWAELGMMQMRGGDEATGLKSLDTSWQKDTFNVRVFNTLEILYTRAIPKTYDMGHSGVFNIRYPKDEKPILERYVPELMAKAFGSMKNRYGFAPTTPVQIELYDEREHFSVRTSGLPNIGIQGVCFGRVVASMSPKAEPFNWGNVLWHELGHVFAIQLSKSHVPRWFTEGLSEYETIVRRPEWQRQLDPELYLALKDGLLPGAVDMNKAFTHQGDLDVTTAYYAASQMIVYTAERFGFSKIVDALALWGQGVRTAEVIQRAFGVAAKDYDDGYRAWQMARLTRFNGQFLFDLRPKPLDEAKKALDAAPQSADAHVGLALALLRAHKAEDAEKEIEAALKIDARNMNAHYLASELSAAKDDIAGQATHLRAIQAAGGDGYKVQMALADIAGGGKDGKPDTVAMRAALEAAHRWDPMQADPLAALYKLAKDEKREDDELAILRQLAPIDQHDPDVWRLLLKKLVAKQMWDEARAVGEGAMFVDVESAITHASYARALAAGGNHSKAAYELETALLCDSEPPEEATEHALLAKEYLALGDKPRARTELDKAKQLDPNNAEAKAVVIP